MNTPRQPIPGACQRKMCWRFPVRFYSPNLQRWINRDLVEEAGGINLYAYVRNNSVYLLDPFDLTDAADVAKALADANEAEAALGRELDLQKLLQDSLSNLREEMEAADPNSSWYEQAEAWEERIEQNLNRSKCRSDQLASRAIQLKNEWARTVNDYDKNRWYKQLGRGLKNLGEGMLDVIIYIGTRPLFIMPIQFPNDPKHPPMA